MRYLGMLLLLQVLLALPVSAADVPNTIRLASLEWLPYVGPNLEQGGLSGAVAAAAAKQFGYQIKIDYFPWNRAMQMGGKDASFAGYFPAYYTEERARECYFSAPMGSSTVGLAHLKSTPLQWNALPDLAGLTIGVVAGYSNGEAFDAMVKQGRLTVDMAQSDTQNLRKLLASRIRAAVIDKSVLRYLLSTEPSLVKDRAQVVFHQHALADLSLHVCFQRTPAGQKLQQAFDAALRRMDIRKIENGYFQQLELKSSSQQPGP